MKDSLKKWCDANSKPNTGPPIRRSKSHKRLNLNDPKVLDYFNHLAQPRPPVKRIKPYIPNPKRGARLSLMIPGALEHVKRLSFLPFAHKRRYKTPEELFRERRLSLRASRFSGVSGISNFGGFDGPRVHIDDDDRTSEEMNDRRISFKRSSDLAEFEAFSAPYKNIGKRRNKSRKKNRGKKHGYKNSGDLKYYRGLSGRHKNIGKRNSRTSKNRGKKKKSKKSGDSVHFRDNNFGTGHNRTSQEINGKYIGEENMDGGLTASHKNFGSRHNSSSEMINIRDSTGWYKISQRLIRLSQPRCIKPPISSGCSTGVLCPPKRRSPVRSRQSSLSTHSRRSRRSSRSSRSRPSSTYSD